MKMTMSNDMGSERKFLSPYEEQGSRIRWGRGVDTSYWSNWCHLAQKVNSHYTFDKSEHSWSRDKNEVKIRKRLEEKLKGKIPDINYPENTNLIVGLYASGRFHAESKEEFERKFPVQTHFGLDFDKVRRLEELTKAVNDSIKRAIETDGPLDWALYHAACLEAEGMFYDEGECLIYPVSWYSPVDKVRA